MKFKGFAFFRYRVLVGRELSFPHSTVAVFQTTYPLRCTPPIRFLRRTMVPQREQAFAIEKMSERQPAANKNPRGPGAAAPGALSPISPEKWGPRAGWRKNPRRSVRRRRYRTWGRPQTQRANPLRRRSATTASSRPSGPAYPATGQALHSAACPTLKTPL